MEPAILTRSKALPLAAGLLAALTMCAGCDAPSATPEANGEAARNEVPSGDRGSEARAETPPPAQPEGGDEAPSAAADEDRKPGFTRDRLEQIVAPVALYPDELLMQVLMAATYPTEVAEAGEWIKSNRSLTGKALDDAVADKGWDVSVNSLVHATQALDLMTADPQWTRDLGDAFLAQQDDVLNAVQVMRTRACDLGNLKTNDQQKVIVEDAPAPSSAPPAQRYQEGNAPAPLGRAGSGQPQYAEPYGQPGGAQPYAAQPYGAQPYGAQPYAAQPYGQPMVSFVVPPPPRIVRIVPVRPGYFHVPVYNPRVIFGPPPPTVYYPQVMAYPQATVGVAPIISFGVGLAIGNLLWGDLDWDHRRIYRQRYGRGYYGGDRGWYLDERNWRDSIWRHDQRHRRGYTYQRPEFGNVWNYRERHEDKRWRDMERDWRKDDDRRAREDDKRWKDDDKRWKEQDKQMRKEDDRRAKEDDRRDRDNDKRWQEQDRQMRKDDDRRAKDDDRRREEMQKQAQKQQQQRDKAQPRPDDRRGKDSWSSGNRPEHGGGQPAKNERPPSMQRPAAPPSHGGTNGNRGQERGGWGQDRGDRGARPSDKGMGSGDRGSRPSDKGMSSGDRGARPSDKGSRSGERSSGNGDKGSKSGSRGGDSGKGGSKDKSHGR